jgi:hypothetical protein
MARGTGCSVERTTGWPFEKISCLVALRTDMFGGLGVKKSLRPTRPYHGNRTDVRLASAVPLLLGG